jgi:hypothetical protein
VCGCARVHDAQLWIERIAFVVNPIGADNHASGKEVPTPPRGITSAVLRVPIEPILDQIRAEILAQERFDELSETLTRRRRPRPVTARAARELRGASLGSGVGRPSRGDDHYRRVATEAVRASERGEPIWATLAKLFDVDSSTVRTWLQRARERGFLASAGPGRRVVIPGPRLGGANTTAARLQTRKTTKKGTTRGQTKRAR